MTDSPSVDKVRKVLKIAVEPISLETPIGEEEDNPDPANRSAILYLFMETAMTAIAQEFLMN